MSFNNSDSEIDTDGNEVETQQHTLINNRTSFLPDYLFKAPKRSRHKRQADQYEYTPTKTRCPLLLVADYRFFQEMGSGNTKTTINYLVRFYAITPTFHNTHTKEPKKNNNYLIRTISIFHSFQISLIDRVHKIYNDTVWQDRAVNIELLLSLLLLLSM